MTRAALLLLALGPPPQGLTVKLPAPRLEGAPPAAADAVAKALRAELTAQGYGVLGPEAPDQGQAQISSQLTGLDGGCLLTLTLTRRSDGRVLDQERERASSLGDLPRASRDAVRRVASELRLTWGVRVKLKPR